MSVRAIKDNVPGRNKPLPVALSSRKALTFVEIDHSGVSVYNFGMPFNNPGHPSEDWLFCNKPIIGNATLMQILKQESFRFVVPAAVEDVRRHLDLDCLPSPTTFPYGTVHNFDMDRYAEDASTWGGDHYPPSLTFRNDSVHVAVVSQSVVQDFWWLHLAKEAIEQTVIPVYFVPRDPDSDRAYHVVVPVPKSIRLVYDNAWRRFVKQEFLHVKLFEYCGQVWDTVDSKGERLPIPVWYATIVESPSHVKALKDNGHLAYDSEALVLCVHRPDAEQDHLMPNFILTEFNTLEQAQQSNPEH